MFEEMGDARLVLVVFSLITFEVFLKKKWGFECRYFRVLGVFRFLFVFFRFPVFSFFSVFFVFFRCFPFFHVFFVFSTKITYKTHKH